MTYEDQQRKQANRGDDLLQKYDSVDWFSLIRSIGQEASDPNGRSDMDLQNKLFWFRCFLKERNPPHTNEIQQTCFLSILCEIFTSLRTPECQIEAVKTAVLFLKTIPDQLESFISLPWIDRCYTFLQNIQYMSEKSKKILPYLILKILITICSLSKEYSSIIFAEHKSGFVFYDFYENYLQDLLQHKDQCEDEFIQKIEQRIYKFFHAIIRYTDVECFIMSSIFEIFFCSFSQLNEAFPVLVGIYMEIWNEKPYLCQYFLSDEFICILNQSLCLSNNSKTFYHIVSLINHSIDAGYDFITNIDENIFYSILTDESINYDDYCLCLRAECIGFFARKFSLYGIENEFYLSQLINKCNTMIDEGNYNIKSNIVLFILVILSIDGLSPFDPHFHLAILEETFQIAAGNAMIFALIGINAIGKLIETDINHLYILNDCIINFLDSVIEAKMGHSEQASEIRQIITQNGSQL